LARNTVRKLVAILIICAILSGAFLFISQVVAAPNGTPVKIMPLGDSITVGYPGNEGYRRNLYTDLTNSGFNVDFVGSQKNGTGFDNDNEGHMGFQANNIRDNVYGWLVSNPADIILLHIGTNDIDTGQDVNGIINEVRSTLDNIDQWEADHSKLISVFLARIILRSDNPSWSAITQQYNNALVSMAAQRTANGDHIVVVDMEHALNYPDDLIQGGSYPGIHPNPTGYQKMANVWYNAVANLLGYKLTLNNIGHGTIAAFPNQTAYAYYTTVNLTAAPDYGWTFNGWSGDLTGTSNPASIIMDNNKNVTATFTQIQYKLTMTTSYGTVTPAAGEYSYAAGSNIVISASPPIAGSDEKYTWLGWNGTGTGSYSGTNTSAVITINGPITQTALWKHEYKLKLLTNSGTTTPSIGEYWYEAGTPVTITATPVASTIDTRPLWLGWAGSGSFSYTGTNNPATLSMNGPITETAQWTTEYKLMVKNIGVPQTPTTENWYSVGSLVTLQANPPSTPSGIQYLSSGWTGTGSIPATGSDASVQFRMNMPSNITWLWKTQYYLTVNSPYGTSGGAGWYDAGSTAYATINPTVVSQFIFTGWSGDATGTSSPSNAIVMDNPRTATANWISTQTSTPTPMPSSTIKPTPSSSTPKPSETTPTPSSTQDSSPSPSSTTPTTNNGLLIPVVIGIGVASTGIATVAIRKSKNRANQDRLTENQN
jgi:uncharacterized repeat protein (TIGR02543 family)